MLLSAAPQSGVAKHRTAWPHRDDELKLSEAVSTGVEEVNELGAVTCLFHLQLNYANYANGVWLSCSCESTVRYE